VGRDDAHSEDISWLDVGSEPAEPAPPRLPWPRWFTLAVALAVVATGVAALNHARSGPAAARVTAAPTTSASTSRAAPKTSARATVLPSPRAVSVTRLSHPLLGATAGWELFGRDDGVLVRIQPAAGRITRTTIPDLQTGGPMYLVAGSDQVIIRPLDNEPGYLVPDGKPARQLPLRNLNGPVFPGPASNQMWVGGDNDTRMALETLAGARLAGSIPLPQGSSSFNATPDGAGYLLFPGVGGVYDARPDGLRRITTGALLAVGPTGWLVTECDEQDHCHMVLIGRLDGSRRVLNPVSDGRDLRGVISPDGSTAAMVTLSQDGALGLCLLDLASGKRRVLEVALSQESFDGGVSFSPDGTWLFAITSAKTLAVINSRTGGVGTLGTPLPPLTQLVLRPAR
jgi:WD40-like Beta Propeller Repeat